MDGSAAALRAACWAAEEAARLQVPLRLMHAAAVPALVYGGGLGPPGGVSEAVESEGARWLAEARTTIVDLHPDLPITVDLESNDPIPMLLGESDEARLIVLGATGAGGFEGILAGSIAVTLAAHSHCPVAVIRGTDVAGVTSPDGPVVVGVDSSTVSEPALAMAFEEAASRGAELVAVHAWATFSSDSVYSYARQVLSDWDGLDSSERAVLTDRLDSWQDRYPEVKVRPVVARDRAVRSLLNHSADAQLLVVGSRGRGGFAGLALGSTSQALVHHATCPLMIVRPASVS